MVAPRRGPQSLAMPTLEREAEVRARADALFWLMQDYGQRLRRDPFLKEARLLGEAQLAARGERAWCVDRAGRGMETEYVSFDPPRRVAVRMTRGPWLLRRFAGSWIYEPLGPDRTRVRFRYHLALRWRIPGTEGLVLRFFAREMQKRLDALVHAVETGQVLSAAPA